MFADTPGTKGSGVDVDTSAEGKNCNLPTAAKKIFSNAALAIASDIYLFYLIFLPLFFFASSIFCLRTL